ncbi:UDP-Glycosyltransferase/glycogen phosphorylase [Basidiobolus meristosporus CBS 931.73]|uniref:GDP-Man:Man(3)GlcNAc(2)-PP-Dol alpha-1,2-mannosyltransferase n=1 Tax=Basidiobolus meristosporus CBS 931.73 TaxID=1314790 RepID=A0A1Y1YLV4_9FUNG|nr:UDP-Glycosyltransferase/glycogen phosphorylase [Basidiobolus meristosporus CBS 931.73]|eukprot:ORX98574.1 UDP-Glycosyltransferase/glycogen phosphorylase [Basidiobolus meristosporus CBS 931.73]
MALSFLTLFAIVWVATCLFGLGFTFFVLRTHLARVKLRNRKQLLSELRPLTDDQPPVIVGLFHPYCNAGGGGERVLWVAIRAIQEKYPNAVCVVYSGDIEMTKQGILDKVRDNFGIELNHSTLCFKFLTKRYLVEDKRYKRFTLLGQSLGSIILGWEALTLLVPDVFIDTMGYAFTFPLVKLFGVSNVGAYVHYPTISTDMLHAVQQNTVSFNNHTGIGSSKLLTRGKLIYYHIFAYLYGFVGSFCQVVMVNSTWTKNHILELWRNVQNTRTVYPPCDTSRLETLPIGTRERLIISIAQFRPEKNHTLQLEMMKELLDRYPNYANGKDGVRLVLIGSSRNEDDEGRIQKLRNKAIELDLQEQVEFVVNASYETLVEYSSKALIGLHTMNNEHFGISIVEYMAAGMIPVANNSGGPKMDIVVSHGNEPTGFGRNTGFLATTKEEFAEAIHGILQMPPSERVCIQENARKSVASKFSESAFEKSFLGAVEPLFS